MENAYDDYRHIEQYQNSKNIGQFDMGKDKPEIDPANILPPPAPKPPGEILAELSDEDRRMIVESGAKAAFDILLFTFRAAGLGSKVETIMTDERTGERFCLSFSKSQLVQL